MKKRTVLEKIIHQWVIAKKMDQYVMLDPDTVEKLLNVCKAADAFAGNNMMELQHDLCDALYELEKEAK